MGDKGSAEGLHGDWQFMSAEEALEAEARAEKARGAGISADNRSIFRTVFGYGGA